MIGIYQDTRSIGDGSGDRIGQDLKMKARSDITIRGNDKSHDYVQVT
jgi:hypothetical protein